MAENSGMEGPEKTRCGTCARARSGRPNVERRVPFREGAPPRETGFPVACQCSSTNRRGAESKPYYRQVRVATYLIILTDDAEPASSIKIIRVLTLP